MAPTTDVVEIRNETPLDISIHGRRTVRPLEVVEQDPPGELRQAGILCRRDALLLFLHLHERPAPDRDDRCRDPPSSP